MSPESPESPDTQEEAIHIFAVGGSTRPGSSTEKALTWAAKSAEGEGATVTYLMGRDLLLPIYDVQDASRTPAAQALVDAVRTADGLLIASPGYHGGISGMVKNALDYIEDLAAEDPPYLHGRAVGCISVAHGWQATVGTLGQIRQTVHALRGWPTPLGGTVNTQQTSFDEEARPNDDAAAEQLATVGRQVVEFARMRRALGAFPDSGYLSPG